MKNGTVLHVFASTLANGSRATRTASTSFTILDAVFHAADNTYYVLDVLAWAGVHVCNSGFDSRAAWAMCQLRHCEPDEDGPVAATARPPKYRLVACAVHCCDAAGISAAYGGTVPYERDGLLLVHRYAPYVMQANPFALRWKDAATSRWPVDTDSEGHVPKDQEVVRPLVAEICQPSRPELNCAAAYQRCDEREAQTQAAGAVGARAGSWRGPLHW